MDAFQDAVKTKGLVIFQLMEMGPPVVTENIMRRGFTPEIIS
jgi:hypothetical protein